MKASILYYSKSGNTEKGADFIKKGLEDAGLDVKVFNIDKEDSIDFDFVNDSNAVLFGTPTYAANMCWQMKKFLDTNRDVKLAGKLGGAFATENYVHGGGDVALQTIIEHVMVKGMLAYSSGGGCGQPVIHLGPVALGTDMDAYQEVFTLYGKRFGDKTMELFG